jgi:hypothetical protein
MACAVPLYLSIRDQISLIRTQQSTEGAPASDLKQIQSIRWYTWPSEFVRVLWRSFARDFKEGSAAPRFVGAAYILLGSIGKEKSVDAATNEIPITLLLRNCMAVFCLSRPAENDP